MTIRPEDVAEILQNLRPYLTEVCEVSLADWQDNPNSVAWVKCRLPDETHLEIFRGKNRAGRTQKWGQRYQMLLIEIADDEVPMEAEEKPIKPRKLSQIAGGLCHDPNFRAWVTSSCGEPCPDADAAAVFVRDLCGVESRAHLDTDEAAAQAFRALLADWDAAKRAAAGA